MGYVTKEEVECTSCGRIIRKNELQYDSPEGRICLECYKGKEPRQTIPLEVRREPPKTQEGEKVLGGITVMRPAFGRTISEQLLITPDLVIVARLSGGFGGMLFGGIGAGIEAVVQTREAKKKGEEYAKLSLESILKADKHNYAIPNSEITNVELKSKWSGYKLDITTSKKKHKWTVMGMNVNQTLLTPSERKKYEGEVLGPIKEGKRKERAKALKRAIMEWGGDKILQVVFPDKLSVKK